MPFCDILVPELWILIAFLSLPHLALSHLISPHLYAGLEWLLGMVVIRVLGSGIVKGWELGSTVSGPPGHLHTLRHTQSIG
ncbi:hypothetical protein GGS21DRAFT_14442 [Xylaria nigripes]|nr:hypothetical protein GGS21DRAFT_14442 [Xylaria nigripes]